MVAVTHIKTNQAIEDGVAQNMVLLEEISRARARQINGHTAPLTCFGIVTNAHEWHFVECKLDLTKDLIPKFYTSKLSVVVNYASKERTMNTESIFGHIVWLLEKMVGHNSEKSDLDIHAPYE
ncbi:unnamed protein product [Mortierella alpina]